jgi:lipoprotein-releasing system ATP-binding protein
MGPVLEARGLSKSFPSGDKTLRIFDGLEFSAAAGEMVAVVGASGVGKSTLLHLLGGVDRPTGGEVCYRGTSLASMGNGELARFRNRAVGFVFQFHFLMPDFTALENVMMPMLIGGLGRGKALRKAAALLAEVGLGERTHHRPGELSGGEQQRVAIARAVGMEPDVLLADEPTGNLDHETGSAVFEVLQRLNRDKRLTIVLVTHNIELAASAGRCLQLFEGSLHPFTPGAP